VALLIAIVAAVVRSGGSTPASASSESEATFLSAFEQPLSESKDVSNLKLILTKAEPSITRLKGLQAALELGLNYDSFVEKLASLVVSADDIKTLPTLSNKGLDEQAQGLVEDLGLSIKSFQDAAKFWRTDMGSPQFRDDALAQGNRYASSTLTRFNSLQRGAAHPDILIQPITISPRHPGRYTGSKFTIKTKDIVGLAAGEEVHALPMPLGTFEKTFGTPDEASRGTGQLGRILYKDRGLVAYVDNQHQVYLVTFFVRPDQLQTQNGVKAADVIVEGVESSMTLDHIEGVLGKPLRREKQMLGDVELFEIGEYGLGPSSVTFIQKEGHFTSISFGSKKK